jgi:amidase
MYRRELFMNYLLAADSNIFSFSKENKPVLQVSSGDTIAIYTCDCFADQIQKPEDKLEGIDWNRVNPATGPIFIDGAQCGDTLKISIEDISLNCQGVMAAGKDLGVLGSLLPDLKSKIIPIENNRAIFNEVLSIPLNPMIGVIGVAPAGEAVNCGTPGSHGGNMDNNMISAGAVLYLPVFNEGGLFALGDLHAAMGNGEIGVTGIEIAGKVTVKLELIKSLRLTNPILQNKDYFTTIASAETLDEAVNISTKTMFEILSNRLAIEEHELVMLMSAVGSTEICQVVDPLKTARFTMPNWVLEKYNFKLQ